MCCQEPGSSPCEDSGSKLNHKRNLSNGTSELSPPRRSKRQKSTLNLKEPSSAEASDLEAEGAAPVLKQEIDDKPPLGGIKKKRAPVKQEPNEDIKTKKPRKSKKDQETGTMPLAPRTQGLRMFVGAHVSAAKGQCRHFNQYEPKTI